MLLPQLYETLVKLNNRPDERLATLSMAVDLLNHRHGRDKVRLAVQERSDVEDKKTVGISMLHHPLEWYSGSSLSG